jgi:hypothetical protein
VQAMIPHLLVIPGNPLTRQTSRMNTIGHV